MLEFIQGPLVWIAFGLFVGGLVFQGARFFRLTKQKARLILPPSDSQKKGSLNGKIRQKKLLELLGWLEKKFLAMRFSVLGTHPVMTGVTVVFHLFLFTTPIFLLAHNTLLEEAWGIGLPSLAESVTDTMTIIMLMCGAFFLLRRIFVRRVRAITTSYDCFLLVLTMAPFLTGFFAYHHWFDYKTVLMAHILSGELMLIIVPFTKLGHMIYFFLYRFLVGSEYSFGQGKRAW